MLASKNQKQRLEPPHQTLHNISLKSPMNDGYYCRYFCNNLYYSLQIKQQIMNSLLIQETRIRKESQIYDDLSNFIQIFKKVINLLEQTAINIQKGNEYMHFLERIRANSDEIEPILSKYGSDTQPLAIQRITFHRFVSRITETIAVFKIKYQSITNVYSVNCFITCLKEIESVIRKYQEEQQFARILQITQILLMKFCMNCEGNVRVGSNTPGQNNKMSETMKKMNEKIVKFKREEKRSNEKSYFQLNYSDESDREDTKTVPEEKKDKIPTISQALSDIQKKFETFKGMDVDFSSFKTSYFQAKNNYTYYYKECIQRNTPILRIITTYHDDFQLFLKRRQLKCHRKNKRLRTNEFNDQTRDKSVDQLLKHKRDDNKESIRIKKNKVNQTYDEKSLKQKIFNQVKEKEPSTATDIDNSKVFYKMKNVYITLGKKNLNKPRKNNLSPGMIKKKILQTQSNNQSYLNQSSDNQKYSTLYLQKKMKFIQEQRIVQRLKTENEKIASLEPSDKNQSSAKMIQDKIIGYVLSPTKAQLKGKYLEINCINAAKEANSKSRLLLNGVHNNKFPPKTQQKPKFVIELKHM